MPISIFGISTKLCSVNGMSVLSYNCICKTHIFIISKLFQTDGPGAYSGHDSDFLIATIAIKMTLKRTYYLGWRASYFGCYYYKGREITFSGLNRLLGYSTDCYGNPGRSKRCLESFEAGGMQA